MGHPADVNTMDVLHCDSVRQCRRIEVWDLGGIVPQFGFCTCKGYADIVRWSLGSKKQNRRGAIQLVFNAGFRHWQHIARALKAITSFLVADAMAKDR